MTRQLRAGFLLLFLLATITSYSQVLLQEDFSTATGTTPPAGWVNNDINSSGEVWYFNNPGSRTLNTPISSPAAIFDSDYNGSGGGAEDAALESPAFDASSGIIMLTFDHYFLSGFGGAIEVEVYDGTIWNSVYTSSSSTSNPQSESFNITTAAGGSTAAKVRFHWTGNYSYYWIVDNVTVSIISCAPPTSLSASNITASSADLSWTTGGATNWDIEYGVTGFTPGSGTTVNTSSNPYSLTGLTDNTTYDFYVRDVCGAGNVSSWAGPVSFTTLCNPLSTFPATEDFSSGFPPACWMEADAGTPSTGPSSFGSGAWTNDGFANNGTSGAAKINLYTTGKSDWLITPSYDLTSGGPYQIEFDFGIFDWNTSTPGTLGSDDQLQLLVTTNGGASWISIATVDNTYITNSGGNHIIADLTALSGSTVQLAVWATEGTVDDAEDVDVFIDNINVRLIPSCQDPTSLTVSNVTTSTADVSWTSGGASNWDLQYGPTGFTPGTGTIVNATTTSYTLTGLTHTTTYDVYVRDSCGAGSVSSWVGPVSFTTPCLVTAPYTQDFENAGSIPLCWSQGASNSENWRFANTPGSNHIGNNGTIVGSTTSGGYFAWVDDSSPHNTGTTLESPMIDVSALTVPMLKFYRMSDREDATNVDFRVEAWDGAAWTQVYFSNSNTLNGGWELISVPLNNLTITGAMQFRFIIDENNGTDFDDDVAIDDISVVEAPNCIAPSALAASNLTSATADLSWISGGATTWDIEYGAAGFTSGTGTIVTVTTNPYTLTGLSANTSYDAYVRDNCGGGDVSAWSSSVTFTTPCTAQLSGTYTINSASPTGGTNFMSFSAAATELNDCGVSGPVTFNVAAGTYSESVVLNDIAGTNSTNTITFDGGDSTQVEVTHSSTTDEPTFYFNGADWVTISNMTISNTSTSDGWGIMFQNSSNNNTVTNSHIKMPVTTSTDIIGLVASAALSFETSNGDNASNLTITNNKFSGGETGIHLTGGSTDAAYNTNNLISGNTFRKQDDHAIEVDGQANLVITGNDIDQLVNSLADAIYLIDINDFTISSNKVISPDYGIYVNDGNDAQSPSANSQILNNMVVSTSNYGLYLNDFEYVEVYHNSLVGEPAMLINDQSNTVIIKNNIMYSTADYAFESTDSLNSTDVINYNLYYSSGTNSFEILTDIYADLAAWQTAAPSLNVNSLEGDPQFVGPTDLHVVGTLADGTADPSVGVTTDIDGDVRSSNPDMGADEFTPPSCSPSSGGMANSITSNSAVIFWTAGSGTTWDIEYGVSGFAPGSGTMVTGITNTQYALSGLSPNTTYDFYVLDDCGASSSPWVGPFSFTTLIQTPRTITCTSGNPGILLSEEFDGTTSFTGDIGTSSGQWQFDNNTTSSSSTGPSGPHSGTHYIFMETSGGTSASMVSPAIDLSAGNGMAELSFWMHAYGATIGTLDVGVSTSATGPFTTVFTYGPGQLQTDELDPYVNVGVNLDAYLGQTIYIEFFYTKGSSFTGDLAIDLVEVKSCVTCPLPTALATTTILANSADLSWTESGTATQWQVSYGAPGFTPGSGTEVVVNTNPYNLSGLTPNTSYDWYVRSICAAGDTSGYAGVGSFTTPCASFSAPYLETFTGTTTPSCWSQYTTTGGPWVFTGTPDFGNTYAMPDHTSGTTNNYAWVDQSSTDVGVILESPVIDISSLTTPQLSYWIVSHNNTTSVTVFNKLYTEAWNGSSWVIIDSVQGDFGLQWKEFTVNLSGHTFNTNLVQLRFRVESGGDGSDFDNDILLDDVSVRELPSCIMPSALSYTSTTAGTADLSWTSGGATNWNLEYGPAGFTPGTGTMVNPASIPYTVTGLTNNLAYEFYVRDSCAVGDVSGWAGPSAFGSLVPCDNFDGYATGLVDPQSILINGWAGAGGDAAISTDYASSGTNSLKIYSSGPSSFSDVVAEVGTYNSGAWNVAMDVYIPATYGGYYNILHHYGSPNVWAIEVNIDATGTATVAQGTNGTGTIGTYSINMGAWNTIEHMIDLDNDTAYIVVNGTPTNVGWQFSLGSTNFGDQFNAVNFYSAAPGGLTPLIYFDDFCITPMSTSNVPCDTTTSAACNHTFILNDDWGDGWNGTEVTVYQNNMPVLVLGGADFTSSDGSPAGDTLTVSLPLCDAFNTYFVITTGSNGSPNYSDEIGLMVMDPFGNTMLNYDNSSTANQGDTIGMFMSNCVPAACPAPNALGAYNFTTTSADIYWTGGGAANFNVEYGVAGFTPGSGTMLAVTNDTLSLTGLTIGTNYEFYVQDDCGSGSVSIWRGPFAFSTMVCTATNTCTYTADLSDAFGDGWNGTVVTVYQNNVAVATFGQGFTSGSTFGPVNISLCDAINTHFVITTGSNGAPYYSEEIGFTLTDPFSTSAGSYAASSTANVGDTLLSIMSNCTPPACAPPTSLGAYNLTISSGDVFWTASGALSYDVEYGPQGFTPGSGTMVSSVNDTLSITGLASSTCFSYYVRSDCGNGDLSTWSGPFTFCTLCAPISSFPYVENFDAAVDIPNCYSTNSSNTNNGFRFYPNSGATTSSATGPIADHTTGTAAGVYLYTEASTPAAAGDTAFLYLPEFNTSSLTNPEISFWYHMYGADIQEVELEVYNSTTMSWSPIFNLFGQQHSSSTTAWDQARVNLSAYSSSSLEMRIIVVRGASFNADVAIDDIFVGEAPACIDPMNLSFVSSTLSSISLMWMPDTNVYGSSIEYGAPGFTPGTGTIVSGGVGSGTITGLASGSCFDIYVLDSCTGGFTNWVGPLTACTQSPCIVTTMPVMTGDSTGCGGGGVTIYGTSGAATGNMAILMNGVVRATNDTLMDTIGGTTIYQGVDYANTNLKTNVGPMPSIAAAGFGNFTNGQWITVHDTITIDSTTVRANGAVTARVQIWDVNANAVQQLGETFTTGTVTGNYQVPVGVLLMPGSYYMNVDFLSGTGQLFRATGGAVFPYVAPGFMTIDSVNFAGPRYYYTFNMVVSGACIGSPANAIGFVPGPNAGLSDSVNVCESNNAVNLASFIGPHTPNATWIDNSSTGALTDSIFNATMAGPGTYTFTHIVAPVAGCAGDTAVVTVTVDAQPFAGTSTTASLCITNTSFVNLAPYLTGADGGGTWSDLDASGILAGNRIRPSNGTPGTYRYQYSLPANGTCSSASAIVTVTIGDTVNAGMDVIVTLCDTSASVDLSIYLSANATAGGTWVDMDASGGLTANMFDPSMVADSSTYRLAYVVTSAACGNDTAIITIFVDDCDVSLNEYRTSTMKLYPNPTSGILFLENKLNGNRKVSVEIIDMNGKLLVSDNYDLKEKVSLDISDFAKGVYSLRITTENGVEVFRIVKD